MNWTFEVTFGDLSRLEPQVPVNSISPVHLVDSVFWPKPAQGGARPYALALSEAL